VVGENQEEDVKMENKNKLLAILVLFSLILTGCGGQEVQTEDISIENEVISTTTENEEVEEENQKEVIKNESESPDEILVYNETLFQFDEKPNLTQYYEKYDRPYPQQYIKLERLGINEDYPYVKVKIKSEDFFDVFFMQGQYKTIMDHYEKIYGNDTITIFKGEQRKKERLGIIKSIETPYSYDYTIWLEDYRIPQCDILKTPHETKEGYSFEGSCLLFNPNWKDYGLFMQGVQNVEVEIYKVKGELPKKFEELYFDEENMLPCKLRTDLCSYTWEQLSSVDSYDGRTQYYYRCTLYYHKEDQNYYEKTITCFTQQEICNNLVDDDEDKLVDCKDSDCKEDIYCKE
jgi:hypothetical protein